MSQTNSGPAIQLGATYNDPRGWYAGAWTSNVNPYPFAGDAAEVDAYTGYALGLGDDVLVRLAYTHYGYVHDPRSRSFGYNEWTTSATIADVLTASVAYQPDYVVTGDYGSVVRHPAFAYELTARCPLAHGFAATGGAGYYDLHRLYSGLGYRAGSAGADYRAGRVTIDVRRFFTAHPAVQIFGTASADGDWAASVVYRF